MKREVAATLGELERKLRELQDELAAVSRRHADQTVVGEQRSEPERFEPEPQAPGTMEARLIDERPRFEPRFESSPPQPRRSSQTAAPGEARSEALSIDLVELVRFKEKLESTLGELIDEYSRIISLRSTDTHSNRPQ